MKTIKKLLPLSGIIAFVTVLAAHLMHSDLPSNKATLSQIVTYYHNNSSSVVVSAYLIAYSAFFIMIFAGCLYGAFNRKSDKVKTANIIGFTGAALFAVGLLLTSMFNFILGDAINSLSQSSAQVMHELFYYTLTPVNVAAVLFLGGYGLAILKSNLLPRWLGWFALVFACIGILPHPIGDYVGFVGLGLWLIIVSIFMTVRNVDVSSG